MSRTRNEPGPKQRTTAPRQVRKPLTAPLHDATPQPPPDTQDPQEVQDPPKPPDPKAPGALDGALPGPEPAMESPPARLLHTPEQAAVLLQVPASWLRKKAAAHLVPHTRIGRHLRFSDADLTAIIHHGARPPSTHRA
jgi:excisionase family DNA binding protein